MLTTSLSRIWIAALVLSLSMGGAQAQEQEQDAASEAWADYLQSETEEDMFTAIRTLVGEGDDALDFLNDEFDGASGDEQLDITYFTATIISQGGLPIERPVPLPEALAEKLAGLLDTSDDAAVHGNIANIAAAAGPSMSAAAPGLLELLRRTEDPGMRATVSVGLGVMGEEVLPLLHDELRNGEDDRVRGDIAWIMAGTDMPDDVLAAIEELLDSDNPETREKAVRTLRDSGLTTDNDAVVTAAIANL